MKFTKMHGIGNDYVYVNCLEETVRHPEKTARFVSDRHFGIGSDGLILIRPSKQADFEMAMYNADGSRGEMCGNAIRCVAKYVYDHRLVDQAQTHIRIETLAGIKDLDLTVENGKAAFVHVNMGKPELSAAKIPVIHDMEQVIGQPVRAGGSEYQITCVSMGNPHCVVFMDDVDGLDIEKTGPEFEHHALFPNRINTEFVNVLDRETLRMRVWERGSGETLACGTGACAAAVAAILNGYADRGRTITVKLRGGDLNIAWDPETDLVHMTGPAASVFEGEIALPAAIV